MNKELQQEIMKRCGFREDFDWETRFDLKTRVGKYEVSTVDLGLDHSFGLGEPLYYETMVFVVDDYGIDYRGVFQKRYTTEEQAREGHEVVVEMIKEGLLIEEVE